jgi:protein TonB
MRQRLFEDLVVSAPPVGRFGRRAAILPLSIAAHAGALATALLFPVLRPGALPDPTAGSIIWEMPAVPAPPPALPTPPPPTRVTRVVEPRAPSRAPAPSLEVETPAAAPGPTVSTIEPEGLPAVEGRAPCFVNCEGAGLGNGNGPPPSDNGPGDQEGVGTGLYRPGGDIKPPVRTVYVAPPYPDLAKIARIQGLVVVECTIDPSGRVVDARVITGHPLLQNAALDAVRQWRYTATRLNGVPISVLMTVTVNFTLGR